MREANVHERIRTPRLPDTLSESAGCAAYGPLPGRCWASGVSAEPKPACVPYPRSTGSVRDGIALAFRFAGAYIASRTEEG